ncbi:MAG: DNA-processing protein DprA [Acidobacteriota bacterium]
MGRNLETEKQSISFTVLSQKNIKAMTAFLRKRGSRERFFSSPNQELTRFGFTKEELKIFKKGYREAAAKEMKLAEENRVELIFFNNDYYPPLLREIFEPPDYIYVKGDREVLKSRMLAVVGSRKGSQYGRKSLEGIIPEISGSGITIVSGMAYGIDSMSHREAVATGGKTIGVNAGGLLKIYPSGNSTMIGKVLDNGCVVSEFPLETEPRPHLFPVRNRIIAGMSEAVLVVEAEMKSGSLITARLGLEQNRDIFSIPGKIDSPLSKGTNYLIQQGAKLITTSRDILIEFGIKPKKQIRALPGNLSPSELKILDLMSKNDVNSINYFVEKTGNSVSQTLSILMGMVLKNLITEEDGGFKKII